jgi:hypothetical protein
MTVNKSVEDVTEFKHLSTAVTDEEIKKGLNMRITWYRQCEI